MADEDGSVSDEPKELDSKPLDDFSEKREFFRFPEKWGVEMKTSKPGETEELSRWSTRNVSRGGALIESDHMVLVGDDLEFDLLLPKDEKRIHIKAVVRWLQLANPEGFGVEFLPLDPDDRALLDDLLDEERATS